MGSPVGFSYVGGSYSSCSFQIRVVKLSDAGDYHFRFETDQPLGRWTSPDTVRLDVTGESGLRLQDGTAGVGHRVCLCVIQTSRSRCIQPVTLTRTDLERPCLWAVRHEDVLLREGTSRCTGVLRFKFPVKNTKPDHRLMSCTQEWTESRLLREVDGHPSL